MPDLLAADRSPFQPTHLTSASTRTTLTYTHTHTHTSDHHTRFRCWVGTCCDDATAELDAGLADQSSGLSITASVQLVMPLRSQLMRSHQRINSGAPPVGLVLPLGLHLISCSFEAIGKHPEDVAKPLEKYLPELILHWQHTCSFSNVSVPDPVPQSDP